MFANPFGAREDSRIPRLGSVFFYGVRDGEERREESVAEYPAPLEMFLDVRYKNFVRYPRETYTKILFAPLDCEGF
jgi:hypothetical protein